MNKVTAAVLCLLFGFLTVSGCTVHTVDMQPQPSVAVQPVYSEVSPSTEEQVNAWWLQLNDPDLDALIKQSLANNLSLAAALARLEQARAIAVQARADKLPFVDLRVANEQSVREGEGREHFTQAGLLLRWEADIFGRLESLRLARQSEVQARREEVETVRLQLSSQIALAYYDAVAQYLQLDLLSEQLRIDNDLLDLTELRFESGLTSSVDMLQQSSQLAETQSVVPLVEASLRLAENRLDVLLGEPPDPVSRVSREKTFAALNDLPFLGVPADLLINRPDLRALRNELVAADAEIGRAIAERLPSLTLNGSLLFEDGSGPAGFVAAIFAEFFQPLIDWGARKAEVTRNEALYRERLALFSQRFLEAIEDVENALFQERKQRDFIERLEKRRFFLQSTVEETTDRYSNGLTDYLPVLDAIKELQRLERQFIQERRQLIGFRIQLYRSLGGTLPPITMAETTVEEEK